MAHLVDREAGKGVRFRLPLRAHYFVGRERELAAIAEGFGRPQPGVSVQVVAGLGGMGKSELAARYVQRTADAYWLVAWIRADDAGVGDLARLAAALGVGGEGMSPQERADRALQVLNHAGEPWLLVLDNADPLGLGGCCPHSGNGHVLVTTRHRDMAEFGSVLELGPLDVEAAAGYLCARAGRPADPGAEAVAAELGSLPLALVLPRVSRAATRVARGGVLRRRSARSEPADSRVDLARLDQRGYARGAACEADA